MPPKHQTFKVMGRRRRRRNRRERPCKQQPLKEGGGGGKKDLQSIYLTPNNSSECLIRLTRHMTLTQAPPFGHFRVRGKAQADSDGPERQAYGDRSGSRRGRGLLSSRNIRTSACRAGRDWLVGGNRETTESAENNQHRHMYLSKQANHLSCLVTCWCRGDWCHPRSWGGDGGGGGAGGIDNPRTRQSDPPESGCHR